MTGLLAGRTVMVTGVLRPSSIATAVAREAAAQGACLVLSALPRAARVTQQVAAGAGLGEVTVLPLDLTDAEALSGLEAELRRLDLDRLDGVVHSVAQAAPGLLGDRLSPGGLAAGDRGAQCGPDAVDLASWQTDLERALTVSVASLPALVGAVSPLLGPGSAVLALTFESGRVVPGYGWMGPLKAALEASVRGLAVEYGNRGVRVNALSAGPLRTTAGGAVPGFDQLAEDWENRAPLGWDAGDPHGVARTAVALLSDWLPATTGQVLRADGGASLL
ncbi:SDR family oxidoreductase [Actinomyces faecalis]|uniref:SDR family oxidoreductase n=1 Tax=Actinomyces faecalis TaxID=2722820 RepID=UPI0015559CD6|nr:SDR family oxidoreductase [Actinomyces faecalis]